MHFWQIATRTLRWLKAPAKDEVPPGSSIRRLKVNGLERWYMVFVPPLVEAAKPSPLILAFHGATSQPAQFAYFSQLNRRAGQLGYVVAYPAAHGGFWHPSDAAGTDDVAFVEAVLQDLASVRSVDQARIFATGISNGGQMVYRLACALSQRIAAIAVCACGTGLGECRPARPVPVIHFHGTADTFVSLTWAEDAIRRWRNYNRCESVPTVTYNKGDATCRTYRALPGGADVTYCVINGMGHQWPGLALRLTLEETRLLGLPELLSQLGPGTDDLDATGMLLSFFEDHPMK
jgi:polyhydroxybutyrate depolymerase